MENQKRETEDQKKEGEKMEVKKVFPPVVHVFYGENKLTDCMRDILKLHMKK